MARDKDVLIYALDAGSLKEAREWVERLKDSVGIFKIGFQLFLREGPAAVDMVHEAGGKCFLDLKLHDIPHTVKKASMEAARMGVCMFNVHASGGSSMMKSAAEGAYEEASRRGLEPPTVIAVTVLTSLGEGALKEIGFSGPPDEVVLHLSALASASGLSGVVASAREAEELRSRMGKDFRIVCPGVRPAGSDKDDQTRTTTPAEAIVAGADHIVVGRPIREAKDPEDAAARILEDALSGRG